MALGNVGRRTGEGPHSPKPNLKENPCWHNAEHCSCSLARLCAAVNTSILIQCASSSFSSSLCSFPSPTHSPQKPRQPLLLPLRPSRLRSPKVAKRTKPKPKLRRPRSLRPQMRPDECRARIKASALEKKLADTAFKFILLLVTPRQNLQHRKWQQRFAKLSPNSQFTAASSHPDGCAVSAISLQKLPPNAIFPKSEKPRFPARSAS